MADVAAKIRLFVAADLGPGATVALSPDQAHYLFAVMRTGPGAAVAVFNGRDGEWLAGIVATGRRSGSLVCSTCLGPQTHPPDLWLVFAPIKKARTDFIVEKATELGCAVIQPVFTRHTNSERLRPERLRAHAIEAAEQCGGVSVPEIRDAVRLPALLETWDPGRRIAFCDETREAAPAATALEAAGPGPWAILIGPEGGFAADETAHLRRLVHVLPVTLGPRVLRADTAAVAALTLWQSVLGDWR